MRGNSSARSPHRDHQNAFVLPLCLFTLLIGDGETLLLDRLKDFVVVPSSAGGSSSFELHSQMREERATLGRHQHFHGHSDMCA